MGVAGVAGVIAAVTAVAGTTYGVVQGEEQKRQTRLAGDRQNNAQVKAEKQLQEKQAQDAGDAEQQAMLARQRALGIGKTGRRSTILTSPTGVPGYSAGTNTAPKTVTGT